jgi:hypothetical protein
VPDREAREMNERPARWLARPTSGDQQGLIRQFGAYGISRGLLSPATMDVLERNFDRFAPLFVAAQGPPHRPDANLQRWYREHADPAQAEAMKKSLRVWLVARVTEAPMEGGGRIVGDGTERAILGARLAAAEALGDWHDQKALPDLRALLGRLPRGHPVLVAAIRRITDPTQADVLVVERNGRVAVHRPVSELDSMVVVCDDDITKQRSAWRADRVGIKRIWASLGQGEEFDQRRRYPTPEPGSFNPRRLEMYFHDGLVARLQSWGAEWSYEESGRPNFRPRVVNQILATTLMEELLRAGIAPAAPRFVAESVTLKINPGELQVTGLYEFEGVPRDGRVPLRYPIARAPGMGPPRIEAIKLDGKPVPVTVEQMDPDIRFALTPGNVRAYQLEVRYRQSLAGRSAKYLITTAREWGRPLHRGWFQVIIDSSLGQPRFGLPFREVGERPGFRRFMFEASPFRPDSDLVVHW